MPSEDGIFANLAFCIPVGLFMFLLFIYMRSQYPLFYHRNILYRGRPVLGMKLDKNFGAWFSRLLNLKDDEFLKLGGLDALVTNNTFRLLVIFVSIIALPCLLLLVPYYYLNSVALGGPVNFDTFTIVDLYVGEMPWLPLLVLLFISLLVMYGVYAFYANFVTLRQAFLLRPSGFSSMRTFLKNVEGFGSIKAARRRVDISTVTVLIHPIPAEIAFPDRLKEILEKSGIHGIERVQLIGNYSEVVESFEKRKRALDKLESALKVVSDKLRAQQTKTDKSDSDELNVKEKSDLLNQLIQDVNFCASIRPRHKTRKPAVNNPEPVDAKGKVDSLRHYYNKLVEREAKLQEALKEFNNPPQVQAQEADTQPAPDIQDQNVAEFDNDDFEKRFVEETTFISWEEVKDFSANLSQMKNLESNKCALLHFSDFREAARAEQTMLSSRPNAMEPSMAPSPDQINWAFLHWNFRQRWHGTFVSNIYFWVFVLLFAPFVAAVASFVDMKSLGQFSTNVDNFRLDHSHIRTILQGVLAPFCTMLLLKKTGVWIGQILMLRGPMGRTEFVLKLQSSHLLFLLIQVIIIGAIFSSLYEFTESSIAHNFQFGEILKVLRENMPKKSHFFFNFMLQDVFSELMLELLNPKSLFYDRGFLNGTLRKEQATRSLLLHDTTPPKLEYQLVWSRFVVFPFFIFISYAIISPLIVIPALIYFSYAYFVYKYRFAQFGRGTVETGGKYWQQCSKQLIYALILGQLFLLVQYTEFRKGIIPLCLIVGLIILTTVFAIFLDRHFARICDNLSVLEDELEKTKALAINLVKEQNKLLSVAIECLEDSQIVKSKFEGDINDHLNFIDIDPLSNVQKEFNPPESQSNTTEPSILEPYWSMIPLNYSETDENTFQTFDPLQVDTLLDTQYINLPYSHPFILDHSKVLIVAKDLPDLLLKEKSRT